MLAISNLRYVKYIIVVLLFSKLWSSRLFCDNLYQFNERFWVKVIFLHYAVSAEFCLLRDFSYFTGSSVWDHILGSGEKLCVLYAQKLEKKSDEFWSPRKVRFCCSSFLSDFLFCFINWIFDSNCITYYFNFFCQF
jgi:hypothetical protein